MVLAIDPGYEKSGWIYYEGGSKDLPVVDCGVEPNTTILKRLSLLEATNLGEVVIHPITAVVVETLESFGMPVGRETLETVWWTGRFYQAAASGVRDIARVTRRTVKAHICGTTTAKDANIRMALIDRFGGTEKAIGKKANQGPLYAVKSHIWPALAVAVTYWDQKNF